MKYLYDHDLHLHSQLSACSADPRQTPRAILDYALDRGLHTICITDHFWDRSVRGASRWYAPQDFDHICGSLPLPQAEGVQFLFGCETELSRHLEVAVAPEHLDAFDFIVIPTTHFHMRNITLREEDLQSPAHRAGAWVRRLDHVLQLDLPFHKIGLAHLTCGLIAPDRADYLRTLELLPEEDLRRLFRRAAALGVGIELNGSDMAFAPAEQETVLRPYRIAKACGCKFYLGSDAHHPADFLPLPEVFGRAIDLLGLEEKDKFRVPPRA